MNRSPHPTQRQQESGSHPDDSHPETVPQSPLAAGRDTQPRHKMGLARATIAKKDHWLRTRDIGALRQFGQPRGRDERRLGEVELLQRLHSGEVGLFEAAGDGVVIMLVLIYGYPWLNAFHLRAD